jgi:hypothetical protein
MCFGQTPYYYGVFCFCEFPAAHAHNLNGTVLHWCRTNNVPEVPEVPLVPTELVPHVPEVPVVPRSRNFVGHNQVPNN